MRVLHIAQTIAGGIASFLDEIAPFQAGRYGAANVRFLISSGSEIHLTQVKPQQIATFASTARTPASLLGFARAALREIREFAPDIVHLHSSFAGAVVRAALPPGARRPRLVYCPHGWAFGMDVSPAKQRLYAGIERMLARRTDIILCNSQTEYDLAAGFDLPQGKMRVVANGIAWTPPSRREARSGPLRLGFIGRHDRQKGLDILLDVIDRFGLGEMQFEIIGDEVLHGGNGCGRPALHNVTFHGWLPRPAALTSLNGFDALVIPSRWEAFGLVAIEAMRAGVPVLASNRGALPEVVGDGVAGRIFELEDRDALGRLLASLERDRLQALGLGARLRFEQRYLSSRMDELTSDAYDAIVGNAPEHKKRSRWNAHRSTQTLECANSG